MHQPNLLQHALNNPLFTTVLYGAIWGVLFSATDHTRMDGYTLLVHVVGSLVFGAFMTLSMRRTLRRYDEAVGITSFGQRVALQHALKSAEVPADPELRSLLPTFLERYEARLNKQRRSNRLVLPLLLVIYAGNALLRRSWWWLLIGAVFIGLLFWSFRAQRRIGVNLPALRTKLKD